MDKRQRSSGGFTIVEMGIIIVVVALLLSSVLIGQELIKIALLRNVTNQLNSYDTAVSTFKIKYGGLPGDLRNAVEYGLSNGLCSDGDLLSGVGCNGNGNHIIGDDTILDNTDFYNTGSEFRSFWYHLAQAGLVQGSYDGTFQASSSPRTKLRNVFIVMAGLQANSDNTFSRNNGYLVGLNRADWDSAIVTTRAGAPKLLPDEAYTLDLKQDDGEALTGNVRTFGNYSLHCHVGGIYKLSDDRPLCGLTFSMRGAGADYN